MGLLWGLNCAVGTAMWFFVRCRDISTPQTCKAAGLCTLLVVPSPEKGLCQCGALCLTWKSDKCQF